MRRWTTAIFGAMTVGSVHAQASVTLYGVADANIEYTTHNATGAGGSGSRVAVQSGGLAGSRFGLRGTEELGDGLQALFALESAIAIDNGTLQQGGRLWGRQAFVGLAAPYGRLTFGRQYTTLFDLNASYSPTAYATQYEPVVFMLGTSLREDNMVKYVGNFGPVTLEAHWGFGEQPGSIASGAGWGAGVSYRANGFGAQVSYDQVNGTRTVTGYTKAQKVAASGRYDFGAASVFAGYRFGRNDATGARTVGLDNFWWFGGIYRAGALSLTLVYYYDDLKTWRPSATARTSPANPRQWLFVADYGLSKRTDVYLSAAYSRYAALNFDTYNGPAATYVMADGAKSQAGIALGLRHRF